MPYTLATLIQYVKALDLPEHSGLPSNGYFIYSHENEIRRIQVNEIVSQIIQANFEVIDQQTVFPSSGYRRYRVLTPDTYQLNDQSITVTQEEIDNNWVFIVVDDGVSHKELEPKPDNGSIIRDWNSSETDLEFPSVRLFNGKVYRVIQGEESGSEEPNDSDNWELLIENTINLRQVTNNLRIRIGDLGDLDTDNTDNIVDAINEVLELINSINFDIPDLEHENTDTVEISGLGTSNDKLKADVIIDPDSLNVIKKSSAGLFTENSKIQWDNSTKILTFYDNKDESTQIDLSQFATDIYVNGGNFDPVTAILTLELSEDQDPITIDLHKLAEVKTSDGSTIEFSGKGVEDDKLTAEVKISNESGNTIEKKSDGIYSKKQDLSEYAKDDEVVHKTGDKTESIDGNKTFESAPKSNQAASADEDLMRKKEFDSAIDEKPNLDDIKDGKFKVKGVGALKGEGETSANADDNTDVELDLTQDTKDDIQKGIDAYEYDLQKITENGRSTSKYLIIDRESEKRYINYTIRGKGVSTPIIISLGIADNGNERWYARGTISGSRSTGSDATNSIIIDFSSSWTRLPEIFSISQYSAFQFKSVKFEFEGEIYYGIVVGEIIYNHYPTFWTFDVNIRNNYDNDFQISILELSEVDIIDENDENVNVKINNQLISTQAWVENQNYLTSANLPSSGTLSQLETGTDTTQRTYRPKDLSEFVDDNKPKADILSFNDHADEETTSKIPFTIEDGDLDGNSANNEYEVPVDGWYKADFVGNTGIVSGGSNDKQAIIRISIGSSNGSQKTVSRSNIGDGGHHLNLFSILTKLEQGDKVYIEVLNQLDSKVLVVGKMSVLKIK